MDLLPEQVDSTMTDNDWEDLLSILKSTGVDLVDEAPNTLPPSTSPQPSTSHAPVNAETELQEADCGVADNTWEDLLSILKSAGVDLVDEAPHTPPSTSPPPVNAEKRHNTYPQHPPSAQQSSSKMDPQESDNNVADQIWGELHSILKSDGFDLLDDAPDLLPLSPSFSPSPPPPVHAELEEGGYGGCSSLGAAPQRVEQQSQLLTAPPMNYAPRQEDMQPGHLHSQAGASSQGQQHSIPVTGFLEGNQSLRYVGLWNGQPLYEICAPAVFAAPPADASKSKKRKRQNQQEGGQYIKKPPNAFMLFLNEQRPHVEAEIRSRGNAAVNTVLGQKWKSLSQEQQATYYEQADRERRLHAQQHPDWSSSHNYGKKRKRERRRKPTCAEDETQQAKKVCVTPVQTAVTEAFVPQTDVFEPHAHADVFEPHRHTDVFGPHRHTDVFEPHAYAGVLEPHTQTGVFEPHVHTDVFAPHRHTDVSEPHRHTDVFELHAYAGVLEPHTQTGVFEPHVHTDVFAPHVHTDVLEPSIQYVTLSLPPDWMFQQQLPVHSPPPTHTQTSISQSQTSYPANDGAARSPSNHCTASAAHGQTQCPP
uniref:uncharacterized protein LOC124073230 n=1 Tax=Scatophagus argus TaxID=75038 RepID=UPI001ED7DA2C|nr:uncharacterized protein LOC124073230 [Scatophagus argus]